MNPDLLFVYGTLRFDSPHPMAQHLRQNATYLGPGRTPGVLHDLGLFPGLTAATHSEDWVIGDIFALDAVAILHELDDYERIEGTAAVCRFERVRAAVTKGNGEVCTAWVYRYHGPLTGAKRLVHGDYLKRED